MELCNEMLVKLLESGKVSVTFPGETVDFGNILESHSYKALQKIKAIIEDDSLDDFACIEAIVCALEEIGSNGGSRHDFG